MSKLHPIKSAAHATVPQQTHERSQAPSREDQAREEIGHTEITAQQARLVGILFLTIICWVPFTQHRMGFQEYRRTAEPPETLRFYRAFDGLGARMAAGWREGETPLKRWLGANAALLKQIHSFEETLDDAAWVTQRSQPPVQAFMCRLGVGNEKAFIGRDDWLFYEPGINSLTGPGFLAPRQLRKRARSGDETKGFVQPDPVKGIVHFRDELKRHGIPLVVMPIPIKPSIYPEQFSARYRDATAPLQNDSFAAFIEQLNASGVHVYDPAGELFAFKQKAMAYLKTDTHWTPAAMDHVAQGLAAFIDEIVVLDPVPHAPQWAEPVSVTNLGDIATMLKLPADRVIFAPEVVDVRPVVPPAGNPPADVLVLGDSFANIYSSELMNWGRDAGFAQALSMHLQRPVDAIIRNDSGASATRRELAKTLLKGNDVLAGKAVVVWMFAARELALGDWELIPLNRPETMAAPSDNVAVEATVAHGTVCAVSGRPQAGAVYKNFIFKMYVKDLVDAAGKPVGDGEGVVHVFGMRDHTILPIASAVPGDRVAFELRDWASVEAEYGTMKTGELEDIMLEIDKTLYWGVPVK